jgi:amidase
VGKRTGDGCPMLPPGRPRRALPPRYGRAMEELATLDATAQADLVRRRQISPRELVDAALARIDRHDGELGALVHRMDDKARAAADAALPDGPFRGVPIVVKDLGPLTAGDPMSSGMRYLRERGFVAPFDSFLTTKLRAAGFVIVGKSKTPELGVVPTTEPLAFGPARNPYDLGRSPGGSSGGSAAAVAAGLVPIGHGNDGGGSIRIPAACCGLVGLKPTRGRVSLGPLLGDLGGGLVVEGGLTRSVRDTAALLDVLEGQMPGDPNIAPPPRRPFRDEVGAPPGRLRIGYATRALGGDGAVHPAHPDCVAAVEHAARLLASLGHEVEEAPITALEDPAYLPRFTAIWAVTIASGLASYGMLFGAPPGEADVEPLTWALAEIGRSISATDYLGAWAWIQQNARQVGAWFTTRDLYLTPTAATPAPPLGSFDAPPGMPLAALARAADFAAYTPAWNATGQPAISLPLHRTADGLPIGVQLVASFGREDLLLRIASQLEAAQPFVHAATRG